MSLNPSPAASRRPLPPAGEVSTRDLWVMISLWLVHGVHGFCGQAAERILAKMTLKAPEILL
jgi:hypothetical protein